MYIFLLLKGEYEYASHEESSSHQTKKMEDMKDHFDDPQLD